MTANDYCTQYHCAGDCGLRHPGSYHDRMAKTLAQRQADFRKAMKDAGFVLLTAYVTKEQRDKFRQIGGDEWLRERINKAKPKEKE